MASARWKCEDVVGGEVFEFVVLLAADPASPEVASKCESAKMSVKILLLLWLCWRSTDTLCCRLAAGCLTKAACTTPECCSLCGRTCLIVLSFTMSICCRNTTVTSTTVTNTLDICHLLSTRWDISTSCCVACNGSVELYCEIST